MDNNVTFIVSTLGLVFGLLGFATSAAACVIVIGWKNSTHRISYVPLNETRYETDLPPEVRDQLPSSPEPITAEQYMRQARQQAEALEDLYETI